MRNERIKGLKKFKKWGLTEKALLILAKQGAILNGHGAGPARGRPTKADEQAAGARSARPGVRHMRTGSADEDFLARLALVWKNRAWVAESLRQIRLKAKKGDIVRELELTKPERYVLSRYLKAGSRLFKQALADELVRYYKLPLKKAFNIVDKMRSRTYMTKYRRKTKGEEKKD